jgi:hypothetical protein
VFKQLESDDGKRPEQGYQTTYEIGADDTISMSGCPEPQIYRFEVSGDTLRLYVVKPCGTHDAVYNATLFATFPFTRTG